MPERNDDATEPDEGVAAPRPLPALTSGLRWVDGAHPLGVWVAGLIVGLKTLRKEPLLGLKRLALPVSYWRGAEFAYVWRQLPYPPGVRVLDLGSPKDLAVMLARHRGYEVVATDILPDAIALSRRYAIAQGLDGESPGKVHSQVQDGRTLPYPDSSFDAAYSVSVLEHIPDQGDTVALRELVRTVRPGGLVVITVPYEPVYRETFVSGPVYERRPTGSEPIFYERHYDDAALAERLLRIRSAEVVDSSRWGEGAIRMEAILDRLGPFRLPFSPLEAFWSSALLRRLDGRGRGHPMAAFVTLRKT